MVKIEVGSSTPDSPGAVQKRWWLANKTDRAQAVLSVVTSVINYDSRRQNQYQISSRLYGDILSPTGTATTPMGRAYQSISGSKDRLTYNIVQSGIDTLVSKMVKSKPKPLFLTSGADAQKQRKAKKLTKFVDGVFYENQAHKLGPLVLRDAAVVGDGFVQVHSKDGRVKYTRVMAQELYVDWLEGFYGDPRNLYRITNMDRDVLIDLFPEKEALIKRAAAAQIPGLGVSQVASDQITVLEAWHLRSGKDARDGLHCIVINEGTLFEEEWDRPCFPFARLAYSPRMAGYFAQGAAEQLQPIQLDINRNLYTLSRSLYLGGSFKILLENGSKVVKEHLDNELGTIVTYNKTPPQYITPPIVQPEIYLHIEKQIQRGYERLGISQLSAGSRKPEGLDSGKALREYNNIETERFMTTAQAYEDFFLQLAYLTLDEAKRIAETDGDYKVKYLDRKGTEEISWSDIDLTEDDYVIKAYPVSSLPSEPAGRLQTIQEYMQAGLIAPRTGRKLLDFPDLDAVENRTNAPEEWIDTIFGRMFDEGVYTPPEPQDDLMLAEQMALEYYAQAKTQNASEDLLSMIRMYIEQVRMLKTTAQAAMQPQGPTPQAAPMPTPQSDLIPNIPQG